MRICWDSFRSSIPDRWLLFELSKTGGGRIETAMQPATVVGRAAKRPASDGGVEGDLGIIASQATVTAPLTDRAALFLSGRRSYADGSSAPFRRKAKTT